MAPVRACRQTHARMLSYDTQPFVHPPLSSAEHVLILHSYLEDRLTGLPLTNGLQMSPFSTCIWKSNPDICVVQSVGSLGQWTFVTKSGQFMTSSDYCVVQSAISMTNLEVRFEQHETSSVTSSDDMSETDHDFYMELPATILSLASQPTCSPEYA